MSDELYKQYQRKGLSEMRPYIQGEDLTGVSVSEADKNNLHLGGMVARNPKNHADKWFVAQKYFDDNLEPVTRPAPVSAEVVERVARAICAFHSKDPDKFHPGLKKYSWQLWEKEAQAAIAAMQGGDK